MDRNELEAEMLRLPARERAELAERLLASLEDEYVLEDPAEVEAAWLLEAERRYTRYLAGETEVIPALEALASVREELKRL